MSVIEQLDLPIAPHAAKKQEIPIELIVRQPTLLSAINLCITASGLEDKQISIPLGIDAGHWSNLRKGVGHFPTTRSRR